MFQPGKLLVILLVASLVQKGDGETMPYAHCAHRDQEAKAPGEPIRVKFWNRGPDDPFVTSNSSFLLPPSGFSVELFDMVFPHVGLNFTWEVVSDSSQHDILANWGNTTDIVVGGVDSQVHDDWDAVFSSPILPSGGFGMMVLRTPPKNRLTEVSKTLFGPTLISVFCIMFLIAVLVAHIVWFAERKENPLEFPPSYLDGIDDACWWSFVTVTTIGYGDKVPVTRVGRVVSLIWMFLGLALMGFFSGSVASTLSSITDTQEEDYRSSVVLPESLSGVRLAVALSAKTRAMGVLSEEGARVRDVVWCDTFADCSMLVANETVKAYVDEYPDLIAGLLQLEALCVDTPELAHLVVIGDTFQPDSPDKAFAFRSDMPCLWETFNGALMALKNTEEYRILTTNYFGVDYGRSLSGCSLSVVADEDSGDADYNWWLLGSTAFCIAGYPLMQIIARFAAAHTQSKPAPKDTDIPAQPGTPIHPELLAARLAGQRGQVNARRASAIVQAGGQSPAPLDIELSRFDNSPSSSPRAPIDNRRLENIEIQLKRLVALVDASGNSQAKRRQEQLRDDRIEVLERQIANLTSLVEQVASAVAPRKRSITPPNSDPTRYQTKASSFHLDTTQFRVSPLPPLPALQVDDRSPSIANEDDIETFHPNEVATKVANIHVSGIARQTVDAGPTADPDRIASVSGVTVTGVGPNSPPTLTGLGPSVAGASVTGADVSGVSANGWTSSNSRGSPNGALYRSRAER